MYPIYETADEKKDSVDTLWKHNISTLRRAGLEFDGYHPREKEDMLEALAFWQILQNPWSLNEDLYNNENRLNFLSQYTEHFNPHIAVIAKIESLPTKIWLALIEICNIDFMSYEAFLRRLTGIQKSVISDTYYIFCETGCVPIFLKRRKQFRITTSEQLREEPLFDDARYCRRAAIGVDMIWLGFGYHAYPHGLNNDLQETWSWSKFVKSFWNDSLGNVWKKFLISPLGDDFQKVSCPDKQFAINNFGKYAALNRFVMLKPQNSPVNTGAHFCPEAWFVLIMSFIILIVSPVCLLLHLQSLVTVSPLGSKSYFNILRIFLASFLPNYALFYWLKHNLSDAFKNRFTGHLGWVKKCQRWLTRRIKIVFLLFCYLFILAMIGPFASITETWLMAGLSFVVNMYLFIATAFTLPVIWPFLILVVATLGLIATLIIFEERIVINEKLYQFLDISRMIICVSAYVAFALTMILGVHPMELIVVSMSIVFFLIAYFYICHKLINLDPGFWKIQTFVDNTQFNLGTQVYLTNEWLRALDYEELCKVMFDINNIIGEATVSQPERNILLGDAVRKINPKTYSLIINDKEKLTKSKNFEQILKFMLKNQVNFEYAEMVIGKKNKKMKQIKKVGWLVSRPLVVIFIVLTTIVRFVINLGRVLSITSSKMCPLTVTPIKLKIIQGE